MFKKISAQISFMEWATYESSFASRSKTRWLRTCTLFWLRASSASKSKFFCLICSIYTILFSYRMLLRSLTVFLLDLRFSLTLQVMSSFLSFSFRLNKSWYLFSKLLHLYAFSFRGRRSSLKTLDKSVFFLVWDDWCLGFDGLCFFSFPFSSSMINNRRLF